MILIDKPAGMSSFGVVAKVRGKLRAELGHKVKVGHTGTLDPFATGLLILLSGKMTKKSGEFLKLDKEYIEKQSFMFDLEIIFKTFAKVLKRADIKDE